MGSLYSFPLLSHAHTENNFERCMEWIRRSGNDNLLKCEPEKLHQRFNVCGHHFDEEQFCSSKKVRLLPDAVPLNNLSAPIEDNKMRKYRQYCTDLFTNIKKHYNINGEGDVGRSNPNLDIFQLKFLEEMNCLRWHFCNGCNSGFISKKILKNECLHNKRCFEFSKENDMDPGPVPMALQNLTFTEEQLISRINPCLCVYKRKGHQYCYSNHVICFPQNVEEFAKILPHKVKDLSSILTVRVKGRGNVACKDFYVRSGVVRDALLCLKASHKFYKDIVISEENLSLLPLDGDIFDDFQGTELAEVELMSEDEKIDNVENVVTDTCVQLVSLPSQNDQLCNVFDWPRIGKAPINEFTTMGYISQSFPCLYPTGAGDLKAPRLKEVTPAAYFKHMMNYRDGRFARHPRFRFFALNSLLRWTAINDGNVHVNKNEKLKDYTVKELKLKIQKDKDFLKNVMFYCSNLKGTKPYWRARGTELKSMIEQLGIPTVFITLSAADLHWPELFDLLENGKDAELISDSRRRQLIQENPMVADKFFIERVESFFSCVVIPKYSVNDFWYRVEYQHRGSPHIHGVLWLANAPDVSRLKTATCEEIETVIQYFDKLISMENPNVNGYPPIMHPCRKRLREVINFDEDLVELVNKVQRHTICSEGYCLRLNKKTGRKECRFKFPKEMCSKSEIVCENENVEFSGKRNDPLVKRYNAYILQTWRANIDICPVLSLQALINYLVKYLSKDEPMSEELLTVLNDIFHRTDDDKHCKTIIQKLYIRACAERDFSAQEVCHLLMGEKLYCAGGRKFVTINFSSDKNWICVSKDERQKRGKSLIEKYMERSAALNNYSLWEIAKMYELPSESKRRKFAIVQVFPNLSNLKRQDEELYYKLQVHLHIPWRQHNDFNCQDRCWKEIYESHLNRIDVCIDKCNLNEVEPDNEEETDDSSNIVVDDIATEEWMILSRMGPSQTTDDVTLGQRDIDLNHDWSEGLSKYKEVGDIFYFQNFLRESKKNSEMIVEEVIVPNIELTNEQERVFRLAKLQIESVIDPDRYGKENVKFPKRIIVQAKAGTGKILLIHCLRKLIEEALGKEGVKILSPTGASAVNVNGATIHSQMQISRNVSDFGPLTGSAGEIFFNNFNQTKFLFIDEYSLVGCNLFGMVEQRCRERKGIDTEAFGGCFVYLFGDINQLPPVLDTPLYTDCLPKQSIGIHGWFAFQSVEASIILKEIKRQSCDRFKELLEHVSIGEVTIDDYKLLETRFCHNVSDSARDRFKNALRLYPTVDKVKKTNVNILSQLRISSSNNPLPIALIYAKHNCTEAKKGSVQDAGLEDVLYLAGGVKVICKSNLWTEMGLVNGSSGTVVDIIYDINCKPPDNSPVVIMCTFETYKGPCINKSGLKLVHYNYYYMLVFKEWNKMF